MASIEFINKRINSKNAEIAKLEKKLERIKKAESSGWRNNPYYYTPDDLKYCERDIETARRVLLGYKDSLVEEMKKEDSRNIKAILDFLESWKKVVIEHYTKGIKECHDISEEVKSLYNIYHEKHGYCDRDSEDYKNYEAKRIELFNKKNGYYRKDEYTDRMGRKRTVSVKVRDGELEYVRDYTHYGYEEAIERLNKDITEEAKRKYDMLVEKIVSYVGTITDASNLSVGAKGELNGFIIGENGRASVETIGAGGYNIQCFHFRTLIHKINN